MQEAEPGAGNEPSRLLALPPALQQAVRLTGMCQKTDTPQGPLLKKRLTATPLGLLPERSKVTAGTAAIPQTPPGHLADDSEAPLGW